MIEIQIYFLIKICCSSETFIIFIVLCYESLMQKPPTNFALIRQKSLALWELPKYLGVQS